MQKSSMDEKDADSAHDLPLVMTMMPAKAREHKIAVRAFAALVAVVAIVMPFANVRLPRVDAFTPVIQTVMCITDLLTAALLFAQYSVQPRRALLVLASGFIFSGLFAFVHTLAFPGAYGPGVLIGDRLESAGWLFVSWHTTFPLAAIVYALSKDVDEAANPSGRSTGVSIGITIACVVAVTAGLIWGATSGAGYLPSQFKNETEGTLFVRYVEACLALLGTTAIVLLFIRRRTILDYWLIVTLLAWLPNFVVAAIFTLVRFSLGWYMGRVCALFAGSALMLVLLTETLRLYVRLAAAARHQGFLVAELDHRVKNTLAQVVAIVDATRQGSRSLDDFVRSLGGRIQAMAAAHTLLSKSSWQNVDLDALVRIELAPYMSSTNIKISGTKVMLTPAEAQALASVLHELATNAVKYGALSIPSGQVSVGWDRKPNGSAAILILEWRELGGPRVASKGQSSYGIALIRYLIPHELVGTVDLMFAAEGVNCRIEFPLRRYES
jgi:two-component sensor histidine kinase